MQARVDSVQRCDSFLHLHLGIDATGLPSVPSEAFPAQWAVVKDWKIGVDAPRNLVRVSIARSRMRERPQPPAHARVHAHAQSRDHVHVRARLVTVRTQVLVSVASLLDPSLAPEGGHVIHAYTPATEPYATWEQHARGAVLGAPQPVATHPASCSVSPAGPRLRPQAQALGGTPRSGGGSRARGQPCHSEPSGRPRHGHH